jgi:prepilin-type N-terminal cleavage/methylation domain-containing protein
MTVKDSKRRNRTCPESTENASHGQEPCESLRVSGSVPRSRAGFTLVELLTVIVIIGILAGMIVGAAITVRISVRRSIIITEIKQLEMALQTYKTEVGEFPPDFAFCDETSTRGDAARARVLRHLRKAFPRMKVADFAAFEGACGLSAGPGSGELNPSTALTFWLGSFHEDPTKPFKSGKPRKKAPFEFKEDQLNGLQYMQPNIQPQSPYVYFRAVKTSSGDYEYGDVDDGGTDLFDPFSVGSGSNVCVPYLEDAINLTPTDPADARTWRAPDTYQIIAAGVDGVHSTLLDGGGDPPPFRFSRVAEGFTDGDYDNLTSFAKGELEDEE